MGKFLLKSYRSYRWSGSYLIDLDQSWSHGIKDLQENTIRTDISQDFSNAQQDVALSNIGLDFVHIDYSLLGTTVTDAQNTAIVNSKGIILTNIPDSYKGPLVFIRGRFESNGIVFFAQDTQALVRLININVSTKVLSGVTVIDLHFDSIRYNITQTLTDAQKQQARTNMGVQSADELLENADFIAQLKTKLETV